MKMKWKQQAATALAAVLCGAGLHAAASAMPDTQYTFHTDVYGPGVANLSSSDSYSRYQWGLKNDAELQYSEITNRFKDSNPKLATYIDLANYLGMPAPVAGPDAYRIKEIRARRGVDIDILPAWNLYDSSTEEHRQVVVAVIDTGIDINHPDLKDAIWTNEDEIPGDGIDNDGNGYVDDVHGWNFFDGNNELCKGIEDNHGTHAAGTIAAARGNGGIAGITDNKYVKVMVLKALGTQYGVGEEKAIIEAIRYAEANGASICNLSFGTTEYYPELEKVMRASRMLFVVSAGNGNAKGIVICNVVLPTILSFFMRFPVPFLANMYGADAVQNFMNSVPTWLTEGFSVAGGLLPALGFALTLFVIGKKQLMPLFFVGYFLVIVSKITVFEAAIFGVCVILLVMTFSNKKAEEA